MKINQIGRSILTNSFFSRMVQMRRCFLTTCTKQLHEEKNIKQMCYYGQEKGRSMVEMLGVLAIIGVLSVGAIAGYSKAMTKYKLNKQAQQLSHLLNIINIYKKEWEFLGKNGNVVQLVPYYQKLGEIPKEMIKETSSEIIYDIFNSAIQIQTNGCTASGCSEIALRYTVNSNNSYDLCLNTSNIGKEFHEYILYQAVGKNTANSTSSSYATKYYGDKYCDAGKKCLKDLSMNNIYEHCKFCIDSTNCRFIFVFEF